MERTNKKTKKKYTREANNHSGLLEEMHNKVPVGELCSRYEVTHRLSIILGEIGLLKPHGSKVFRYGGFDKEKKR